MLKSVLITIFSGIICFEASASVKRIRLTLRGDAATSICIGFDQNSGSDTKIYYGTVDHGTSYSSYPKFRRIDRSVEYRGMKNRFVRISGLKSNTPYFFVIKDSQGISKRYWFKTAPSNGRISIIAGGDSRNNREARRNANRLVAKLKPHAVLFSGDMTDDDSDEEWKTWFDDWKYTIASDGRMFPIIVARGNHESSNKPIDYLFDVPSSNAYYAINIGNTIRIYSLNTEISIGGTQTKWLEKDLVKNSGKKWKIVQYHRAMRPHVQRKREGNLQYNNWAQLFYDQEIKIVVESDAHVVKTTWPIRPSTSSASEEGFIRDDVKGTVYVGEGGWGAPLRENDDDKKWTRESGSFNQIKWMWIDDQKTEIRTIETSSAIASGTVSNRNPFSVPRGLSVWRPRSGGVVSVLANNTTTIISKKITKKITSGEDDVEQESNGNMYLTSSDLDLVNDGSRGNQTVGLMFRDIEIPEKVKITKAYITFTCDVEVEESEKRKPTLYIQAENIDNASSFSSSKNNLSDRKRTSTMVKWRLGNWKIGSNYTTPNLRSLVQEIVNRKERNKKNNLVFLISGTGKRIAESYEGNSFKAPILTVYYEVIGEGGPLFQEKKMRLEESCTIYPNPAGELLNVLAVQISEEQVNLKVYDLQGKLLINKKGATINGSIQESLDVSVLLSGKYVFVLEDGLKKRSQLLMIE